jgi:hypothetical protein
MVHTHSLLAWPTPHCLGVKGFVKLCLFSLSWPFSRSNGDQNTHHCNNGNTSLKFKTMLCGSLILLITFGSCFNLFLEVKEPPVLVYWKFPELQNLPFLFFENFQNKKTSSSRFMKFFNELADFTKELVKGQNQLYEFWELPVKDQNLLFWFLSWWKGSCTRPLPTGCFFEKERTAQHQLTTGDNQFQMHRHTRIQNPSQLLGGGHS